jgi:hypothetical protein
MKKHIHPWQVAGQSGMRRIYLSVKILWWLCAVTGIDDLGRDECTPMFHKPGAPSVLQKSHIQFPIGVRSKRE